MKRSHSQVFFDLSKEAFIGGRLSCLKEFFIHVLILPFAFVFKAYKTFLNVLGVFLSALVVILSLGLSLCAREWFVKRMIQLAKDLGDWFLWPVSILAGLTRLVFSFLNP